MQTKRTSFNNRHFKFLLLSCVLLFFQYTSFAKPLSTLPADNIPYQFQQLSRLVVIGDIHGDFNALMKILTSLRILDQAGKWIANDTQVVFMGDLVDRGPDSRLVLETIIRITKEAATHKSEVHTIAGNHEALWTEGAFHSRPENFNDISPSDLKTFDVFKTSPNKYNGIINAITNHTPYTQFFGNLNAILQIGPFIFVHAGIRESYLTLSIDEINATFRAWMQYWQGKRARPLNEVTWVIGQGNNLELSPFWTHEFDPKKSRHYLSNKNLQQFLNDNNAKKIFVGHIFTEDDQIHLTHPFYGEQVIMTDTAISKAMGGKISAIEILSPAESTKIKTHSFSRPQKNHPIKKAFMQSIGCEMAIKNL